MSKRVSIAPFSVITHTWREMSSGASMAKTTWSPPHESLRGAGYSVIWALVRLSVSTRPGTMAGAAP